MLTGMIFDIREFTVHDGPGLRTTVFLKGCPLRCSWCHNPEGLSPEPQLVHSPVGQRMMGRCYTSTELAGLLNKQAAILRCGEGGVTFSGGEPLAQAAFVAEVIQGLDRIHVTLDTSGFGSESDFRLVAGQSDLVLFDLKLMDPTIHRQYTGQDNGPILRNLDVLATMPVPCVIRVPLVPGVTVPWGFVDGAGMSELGDRVAESVAADGRPGLVIKAAEGEVAESPFQEVFGAPVGRWPACRTRSAAAPSHRTSRSNRRRESCVGEWPGPAHGLSSGR